MPAGYDPYGNTTPFDDRVRLPLKDRQVRREVLADGTVVINYEDPPIGAEQCNDLPPLPEPPEATENPENSPGQQSRELDRRKGLR